MTIEQGSVAEVVVAAVVAAVVARALDRTGESVVEAVVRAAKRAVGVQPGRALDRETKSMTQSVDGDGNVVIGGVSDSQVEVTRGARREGRG